jgi:hypothetical protein
VAGERVFHLGRQKTYEAGVNKDSGALCPMVTAGYGSRPDAGILVL